MVSMIFGTLLVIVAIFIGSRDRIGGEGMDDAAIFLVLATLGIIIVLVSIAQLEEPSELETKIEIVVEDNNKSQSIDNIFKTIGVLFLLVFMFILGIFASRRKILYYDGTQFITHKRIDTKLLEYKIIKLIGENK